MGNTCAGTWVTHMRRACRSGNCVGATRSRPKRRTSGWRVPGRVIATWRLTSRPRSGGISCRSSPNRNVRTGGVRALLSATAVMDAFLGDFERAVIVFSDSDLAEPIRIVKSRMALDVEVISPYPTVNSTLRKASSIAGCSIKDCWYTANFRGFSTIELANSFTNPLAEIEINQLRRAACPSPPH
ncbi:hypothetical protein BH24CHL4_BH24CHL4_10410 [soil metagenome]